MATARKSPEQRTFTNVSSFHHDRRAATAGRRDFAVQDYGGGYSMSAGAIGQERRPLARHEGGSVSPAVEDGIAWCRPLGH